MIGNSQGKSPFRLDCYLSWMSRFRLSTPPCLPVPLIFPNRYSRSQCVEVSLTSCVAVEASLDRNRREQICQLPLSS